MPPCTIAPGHLVKHTKKFASFPRVFTDCLLIQARKGPFIADSKARWLTVNPYYWACDCHLNRPLQVSCYLCREKDISKKRANEAVAGCNPEGLCQSQRHPCAVHQSSLCAE
eukprot:1327774-Amorphochlora_amoeboformis.AAC.1